MNIQDYARQILDGSEIQDKLLNSTLIDWKNNQFDSSVTYKRSVPARDGKISFVEDKKKFPKIGNLHIPEKRALAIHFFANHELLAIEMMAQALLMFPGIDNRIQRSLVQTIEDEQKHFLLYCHQMKDLGVEFGDYPVNDFFWQQFLKVESFEQFYALVALTFEQANLDFAAFYRDLFSEMGESSLANVLNIVYEDEITHVAKGYQYLKKFKDGNDFFDYYTSLLPDKITPARAKGKTFDLFSRKKAGLSDDYISKIEKFDDKFDITRRKEWKKSGE